jgi:hypothetical protein
MGVMRLLPVAIVLVLLCAQTLFLSDLAYAYCTCGMSCPTPRCQCDPGCAVSDSFQNSLTNDLQLRSVQSSALFGNNLLGNDNGGGFTLIAIPRAVLKLECQRLKTMLNWVADLRVKDPEFQRMNKVLF